VARGRVRINGEDQIDWAFEESVTPAIARQLLGTTRDLENVKSSVMRDVYPEIMDSRKRLYRDYSFMKSHPG
jgi:hypothetical protein